MPDNNPLIDPNWWLGDVTSIESLQSWRDRTLGAHCSRHCASHVCLWRSFITNHCSPEAEHSCSASFQEADFQRFLQFLRQFLPAPTPKVWTVPEIVDWINNPTRTTEELTRPVVKLYNRQTPAEQVLRHTVHRNAIGFNFKDSRIVESFLDDLRADPHYELSVVGMVGLKELLTRYRRQLTDIANQGA